jgi:hypothetical protein
MRGSAGASPSQKQTCRLRRLAMLVPFVITETKNWTLLQNDSNLGNTC